MADLDSEVSQEVARLKRINRELSRLRVQRLLSGERSRRQTLDIFHNGIVQKLISLRLGIDALLKYTGPVEAQITALRELAASAIESAHLLADDMAPHVLFDVGLKAALHDLFYRVRRDSRVCCSINTEKADLDDIEETTGLVLYDLIERLLLGTVRWYRAETVNVRVATPESGIEISVEDNGISLDFQEIVATGVVSEKPFLVEIAEEVRFLGGQVWIGRSSGYRTVCLSFPRKLDFLSF